jgi:hypothetical protein
MVNWILTNVNIKNLMACHYKIHSFANLMIKIVYVCSRQMNISMEK